jgi:hypothetical protein
VLSAAVELRAAVTADRRRSLLRAVAGVRSLYSLALQVTDL